MLLTRALQAWACTDSEDNTGEAGRATAASVARAFLEWLGDRSIENVTPPEVYDWLLVHQPSPHGRRSNHMLPQRVVACLLREMQYPHTDHLQEFRVRHDCHVSLPAWGAELRDVPGRAPRDDDAQWLWNAYVHDCRHRHKTQLQTFRRWRAQHPQVQRDHHADSPALPSVYVDPRYAMVDPFVRFFAAVRWEDAAEVLELFRTLTLHVSRDPDRRHARSVGTYLRPFYRVCCALSVVAAGGGGGRPRLIPLLDRLRRPDGVAALALVDRDRARSLKAVYQFTSGPWGALLPSWAGWSPIRRREVGYRPTKRQRQRDRFTDEEVAMLREAARSDPVDHGLLLFFLHTGVRSGAVCSLRVDDVFDRRTDTVAEVGRVEEKGGVLREFTIDPLLASALRGAVAVNRGSAYVFPAPRGGVGRRSEHHNDQWLRRLCARCGIHGDHVHVHALRRTTISILLDAGNALPDVSQWIGHSSTQMTEHYWERSRASLTRALHLPWLTVDVPRHNPHRLCITNNNEDEDEDEEEEGEVEAVFRALLEENRRLRRQKVDATMTKEKAVGGSGE